MSSAYPGVKPCSARNFYLLTYFLSKWRPIRRHVRVDDLPATGLKFELQKTMILLVVRPVSRACYPVTISSTITKVCLMCSTAPIS